MAQLNAEKIKKLKKGELIGTIALVACTLILAAFVVVFSVAQSMDMPALRLASLIAAPILMAAGVGVAAYCNIRFGGETERLINNYVLDVFTENAAQMHPERDSLTFNIYVVGDRAEIKVNNYNEKIVFDFSAFGRLSPMRKLTVVTAIENRLCAAFCRLVTERGAKYISVSYVERNERRKTKPVYIIQQGVPDKKALKNFYKNR